jgi:peptidoglycan hydrolase CwlO-like protein
MYLSKTWTGNDPAHQALLETTATALHQQNQQQRNVVFRTGRAFAADDVKTSAEIEAEVSDRDVVRIQIRALTFAYAQAGFYSQKTTPGGNPWHDNLAKVMFWM